MSYIPVKKRINMSLDEISKKELEIENNKLKKTLQESSIDIIYNWIIHIDNNGWEYITGYRNNSSNLFETSNILHKLPLSEHLLIVTENESLYKLPYYSSEK
tara:strand:- start:5 stop:310 length:306 start_codon:yes stop_codon:yes gene_type:complete